MSSSYRAILKTLDDDDVVRGLGRKVRPKKRESCCAKCCSSPVTRCLCIALCLAVGLAMSVAIPLVIVLPVDSQWHFHHWLDNFSYFTSNSSFRQELRNSTSAVPEGLLAPEGVSGNSSSTSRVATFIAETERQWKLMTEWMKRRYEATPKVPLFIGLAIPLVGCVIIACVAIRRNMKRRQRRRAFGKLVKDLQSGKTLLADTDDSDEDCLYDGSKNI